MTVFEMFSRLLRHVSAQLNARAWETTTMQVLDMLAEEFEAAQARRAKHDAGEMSGLMGFGC